MSLQDSSPGGIVHDALISSATSLEEILAILAQRGCADLTPRINVEACSKRPVAGGGFCDVFRGRLNDGTQIAIKSLRVYDSLGADNERQKIHKRAAREIYHWSKLDHPNVLPLAGLAVFHGNMSMISEWMDNGDLTCYIRHHPDVDRMSLCIGICEGLRYIHARGMVHGDLKSANVMISRSGVPQIADFGNSQLKKELTLSFTHTTSRSHSVRWTAPELLCDEDGPYATKEADVYAYGMTVYEVMAGEVPFSKINESRLIFLIAQGNRLPSRPNSAINDDLWLILTRCWTREPTKRPTIAGVADQVQGLVPIPLHTHTVGVAGDESETGRPDSNAMDPDEKSSDAGQQFNLLAQAELIKERGNEFFRKGQYDLATGDYSKAITMNPNEPTYLANRAASYMALKMFAPALEDCQTAVSLQSASPVPKTLLRLARCHLALGDIHACRAVLWNLPDSTHGVANARRRTEQLELYLQRFKAARDKDEWGTARLALEQAVEALEGDVPVQWRCWRVECEIARGDWAAARAGVNAAIKLAPDAPDVLSLRGLIMFLTNRLHRAIRLAQQTLRLDPDHKSAQRLHERAREVERIKEDGNRCFRDGQLDEAVELCGRALEVIGQRVSEGGGGYLRAMFLSNRAIALFKLKRSELAFVDVNASLALDPSSYSVLRTRARIHVELERFEDAIRDYESALTHAKDRDVGPGELNNLIEEAKQATAMLNESKDGSYYRILGLSRNCTDTEIKGAYRRESMIHHPSRGGDEEKFKLIGEAHAVLSDPQQRRRYDMGADEDGQMDSSGMDPIMSMQVRLAEMLAQMQSGRKVFGGR